MIGNSGHDCLWSGGLPIEVYCSHVFDAYVLGKERDACAGSHFAGKKYETGFAARACFKGAIVSQADGTACKKASAVSAVGAGGHVENQSAAGFEGLCGFSGI